MADIVATIQAEQDRIIRADQAGIMVVQGGPGTGKTAVALHRAAYLLYNHRAQLEQRGVLIIGPNPTFLGYISQVLPSLGENAVVLSTIADLFPGVSARATEEPAVARVKGRTAMTTVIANAVLHRQSIPAGTIRVRFDGAPDGRLVLDRRLLIAARDRAWASRRPHNKARSVFVKRVIDGLVTPGRRAARSRPGRRKPCHRRRSRAPSGRTCWSTRACGRRCADVWPVLTAQRLLADLYASPERIAFAADGLTAAGPRRCWPGRSAPRTGPSPMCRCSTRRPRSSARSTCRPAAAVAAADLEYASEVLDLMGAGERRRRPNPDEVGLVSMVSAANLADLHAEVADWTSTAERAAADREWTYGHVIVDEAQELSAMAWRMVMRRCPMRSMTLVGDLAQTSDPAGASSWARVLRPYARQGFRVEELTVNYRTPAEIMTIAEPVLAAIDPALTAPTSVRDAGVSPSHRRVEVGRPAGRGGPRRGRRRAAGQQRNAGRHRVPIPPRRGRGRGDAVRGGAGCGAAGDTDEPPSLFGVNHEGESTPSTRQGTAPARRGADRARGEGPGVRQRDRRRPRRHHRRVRTWPVGPVCGADPQHPAAGRRAHRRAAGGAAQAAGRRGLKSIGPTCSHSYPRSMTTAAGPQWPRGSAHRRPAPWPPRVHRARATGGRTSCRPGEAARHGAQGVADPAGSAGRARTFARVRPLLPRRWFVPPRA